MRWFRSRSPFWWSVFAGIAGVVLLTVLVVVGISSTTVRAERRAEVEQALVTEVALFARVVEHVGRLDPDELQTLCEELIEDQPGLRLTVIAADGTVLADTHADAARLDDQGDRPELTEPGVVERYSRTMRRIMFYHARPVEVGGRPAGWARGAIARDDVAATVSSAWLPLLVGGGIALVVGLLAAGVFARSITLPLRIITRRIGLVGRGEGTVGIDVQRDDEVGELARAVEVMAGKLQERFESLEASRRELEAIVGGIDEGLVAVDHEERVVVMNRAAHALLEARDEKPVGRRVWEVVPVPEVIASVTTCLENRQKVHSSITIPGTESDRVLQVHASPLGDDYGGTWGCVLVVVDLSEQKRLERVRKDFVANASHELKTPLTAIRGYVEALLDGETMSEERRRSFLTKVWNNTRRLEDVVREMIHLARLENETGSLQLVPTEVTALVDDCVARASENAEAKGVELRLDRECGPSEVMADAKALSVALMNLLDNAIKFSPAGGLVEVHVWTESRELWIEVRDRGPGIPVHEIDRIFERFYRVEKGRSRDVGGTGLGLAIVRHIVQAHQGEVAVESTPGFGSAFRVRLRLTSDEPGPRSEPMPASGSRRRPDS